MTLLASGMALLLSTGALLVTALLWRRYRSTSAAKQSAQLMELTENVETLTVQLRNLRSAANMRAYRARKESGECSPDSSESGAPSRKNLPPVPSLNPFNRRT